MTSVSLTSPSSTLSILQSIGCTDDGGDGDGGDGDDGDVGYDVKEEEEGKWRRKGGPL